MARTLFSTVGDIPISTAGEGLVAAADAAAERTALGLGTAATSNSSAFEAAGAVAAHAAAADPHPTYTTAAELAAFAQPLSSSLSAVAAVTVTAAGTALLDDANNTAQRTTLGLGSLATQSGTFSGSSSGTNTGDQTISLTGNVTGSGTGSFAATIATAAVTLAKMADLAQDQFIGRTTASTGVPQTATVTAAARTVLDDATVAAMVTTLFGAASTGTLGAARSAAPTFTGLLTLADLLMSGNPRATGFASATASTTHTQGQGAIVNWLVLLTVNNALDAATLPAPAVGQIIGVLNLSATFSAAIYPPTGAIIKSQLINIPYTLPAGFFALFLADTTTHWTVLGSSAA